MNYSAVGTGFIQILHDGDRHHWLTVSNLDCDQPDTVFHAAALLFELKWLIYFRQRVLALF